MPVRARCETTAYSCRKSTSHRRLPCIKLHRLRPLGQTTQERDWSGDDVAMWPVSTDRGAATLRQLWRVDLSRTGEIDALLSHDEMLRQFRPLTGVLASERTAAIEQCVATLDRDAGALQALNDAILAAP